jgi:hypothetical protein
MHKDKRTCQAEAQALQWNPDDGGGGNVPWDNCASAVIAVFTCRVA